MKHEHLQTNRGRWPGQTQATQYEAWPLTSWHSQILWSGSGYQLWSMTTYWLIQTDDLVRLRPQSTKHDHLQSERDRYCGQAQATEVSALTNWPGHIIWSGLAHRGWSMSTYRLTGTYFLVRLQPPRMEHKHLQPGRKDNLVRLRPPNSNMTIYRLTGTDIVVRLRQLIMKHNHLQADRDRHCSQALTT